MRKKPVVYVMIGLPVAGKSTYLKQRKDADIISADAVRGEWFGDESLQYTDAFLTEHGIEHSGLSHEEICKKVNPIVWDEVFRRIDHAIDAGRDAVIDGINLSKWVRKTFVDRFAKKTVMYGVWITTDIETCIERDKKRPRIVGEETIRMLAGRFETPGLTEGFDILEERDMHGELQKRTVRPGIPEDMASAVDENPEKQQ